MAIKILSFETATESCSVAILTTERVFVRHQIAPREHSKLVLKMVDELLEESTLSLDDIDILAYGAGPGSFTGLRIAASVVQGLGIGANKPVVPISTLQALAQAAWRQFGHNKVLVALDARMHEIYFAFYKLDEDGLMQNCGVDEVALPSALSNLSVEMQEQSWYSIGSGVTAYHKEIAKILPNMVFDNSTLYPSALEVAILAEKVFLEQGGNVPESAIPVYLRNKIANKSFDLLQSMSLRNKPRKK